MKKTLLASAFALATVAVSAQSQLFQTYSGQYDGMVRFTGEVIDQTCVVDTVTKSQLVILDKVAAGSLTTTGKIAGGKAFAIQLENCKTDSNNQLVRAEFKSGSTVDAANNGTLMNTGAGMPGYASNVNLRLKDTNGVPIRIGASGGQPVWTNLKNNKTVVLTIQLNIMQQVKQQLVKLNLM